MKYVFDDFNIETGTNKIILSAPHCYPQLRNGAIKHRETKTGILAKDLAKKLDAFCIYKTKYYENDPNFDEKSPYKKQLVDCIKKNDIKLLIDIHSMHADREADICIGTNFGKNILNKFTLLDDFKDICLQSGFKNTFIDSPFSASKSNVISSYVSTNCHIPCFQIEINNKFLYKSYGTYNYELIHNTFFNFLSKYINKK